MFFISKKGSLIYKNVKFGAKKRKTLEKIWWLLSKSVLL